MYILPNLLIILVHSKELVSCPYQKIIKARDIKLVTYLEIGNYSDINQRLLSYKMLSILRRIVEKVNNKSRYLTTYVSQLYIFHTYFLQLYIFYFAKCNRL